MPLKLLADENLPGAVLRSLTERGLDIRPVKPGTLDSEVGEQAKREQRTIVTFDSDFANILSFPPNEYFGIVRVRVDPPTFSVVLSSLEKIFNVFNSTESLKGKLIIAEPASFRVWEKLSNKL